MSLINSITGYMTPPIEIWRGPMSIIPVASPTTTENNPAPASNSPASNSSGSGEVSTQGQIYSSLLKLQSSNPQQLQTALTSAATKVAVAAQTAGPSSPQGKVLAESATKIQRAASTGDPSLLVAPPPANKVEQTYAPSQPYGNQGVLGLLTSTAKATTSADASTAASTLPAATGQITSATTGVQQILSEVVKELQDAAASS
jgi:hypothetical protein